MGIGVQGCLRYIYLGTRGYIFPRGMCSPLDSAMPDQSTDDNVYDSVLKFCLLDQLSASLVLCYLQLY